MRKWEDVRDPRAYWRPDFGAIFHVRPWEMDDLTPGELDAMNRYLNQLPRGDLGK